MPRTLTASEALTLVRFFCRLDQQAGRAMAEGPGRRRQIAGEPLWLTELPYIRRKRDARVGNGGKRMSISDYRRPSQGQIDNVYVCGHCRRETTHPSVYAPPECCGTPMNQVGESYPGNSEDWDEVRDTPDGEWRERGR